MFEFHRRDWAPFMVEAWETAWQREFERGIALARKNRRRGLHRR
jgi:hypothetical protein